MMSFRLIPSAESGDTDSALFLQCEIAECLGLENIDGAGLRSNCGNGESDMLLTGYCESAELGG